MHNIHASVDTGSMDDTVFTDQQNHGQLTDINVTGQLDDGNDG